MTKLHLQLLQIVTILLTVVIATFALPLPNTNNVLREHSAFDAAGSRNPYRLPLTALPSRYKIQLRPILESFPNETVFRAPGKVEITVKTAIRTKEVAFHVHSASINILEPVVVRRVSDNITMDIVNEKADFEHDFYTLEFNEFLPVDTEYVISIIYSATISQTDLNGMYRSYYTDPNGITRNLAATHMVPTNTRKIFPCFDEPEYKAIFEITLGRKEKYSSLSNSDKRATEPIPDKPGWVWDIYNPTPVVSCYLIAMVVSESESVEAEEGLYTKPVKVWASPHLIRAQGGKFSADMEARVLSFYENQFHIPYEMPKLDSIAVPQFFAGAMENWGLHIYKEMNLLYFPGVSSEADRRSIVNVLSHELAHQWFGNLVTPKWWNDLWLKEGFATYWSSLTSAVLLPEFEPEKRFLIDFMIKAFAADEAPSTHPIHNNAETRAEVNSIFDSISYDKAASVIRMVDFAVGRAAFHEGLRQYLQDRNHKAAEQNDLFASLQSVKVIADALPEGLTVKNFMETWTVQSGYPLVRVERQSSMSILISQERFGAGAPASSWNIPISVVSSNNSNFADHSPKLWLRKNENSVTYDQVDSNQWLVLNAEAVGFYRVIYDEPLYNLLETQLNSDFKILSAGTRAQLINDYFAFANSGYGTIEEALRLTKYLSGEDELSVWTILFNHLRPIYDKFTANSDGMLALMNYFLPKITTALKKIGYEHDPAVKGSEVLLRSLLLHWACTFGDRQCLNYAAEEFRTWVDSGLNSTSTVPPDVQDVVYCHAIANNDNDPNSDIAFNFAYNRMNANTTSSSEKTKLFNALKCTRSGPNIMRLLEDAAADESDDDSNLSNEDRLKYWIAAAENPIGREFALVYLLSNFGLTPSITPEVYLAVMATLSNVVFDPVVVELIQNHMDANSVELEREMKQLEASLAVMKSNGKWQAEVGTRIMKWLRSNSLD